MSEVSETDDDVLLADLARALGPSLEPPPEVLEGARQAYAWRTIDAELAALSFDSLLDDGPATVRSGDPGRSLIFEARALTVEVEVEVDGSGRRLTGQVLPPQAVDVELRCGDDTVATEADEFGRFAMPLPDAGHLIGLRCRTASGAVVVTTPLEW